MMMMRRHKPSFMETRVALARCLCKAVLYGTYLSSVQGGVSFDAMLAVHVVYIVASTVIDCARWLTDTIRTRDYWQMAHHVATWHLLWICFARGPFVELVTTQLLGAVDATDMAFYAFKAVPRDPEYAPLRTVLQACFVIVWFLRRVLVFGRGDWGDGLLQAGHYYVESGDYLSLVHAGIPVTLLLLVNWVWTWEIVVVMLRTLGVKELPTVFLKRLK
jgi:hypothetical protein